MRMTWEYLELRDLPTEGGFGLFMEDGTMYLQGCIFNSLAEAEQYLIDKDLRATIR